MFFTKLGRVIAWLLVIVGGSRAVLAMPGLARRDRPPVHRSLPGGKTPSGHTKRSGQLGRRLWMALRFASLPLR
ncbi:hypothetical protein MES5069_800004 [Mesorhizobium escarrei]|uniref:Secreted protein n=1 Tax=Mesorhizobium escarrei TaxID=666018 RepID=A0ABN8KGD7_9HYPH|nr:hypothetical protein MES5069_800004 [Mesorhizobium escarrei]